VAEDFPSSQLVKNCINKSFYVDDLLASVQTKEEAKEVLYDVKSVLRKRGFNLTKFIVNDAELQGLFL
jgi:hypothetical protein